MSRTAILALDLQSDFLRPDGRLPADPGQVERLIPAVNALIDRARERKIDVAFVANAFSRWDVIGNCLRRRAALEGSLGAAIDSRIHRDILRWPLFEKSAASAFANPGLDNWLRGCGASRVVLAGVMADFCVLGTARDALKRNFSVVIVSDAVAARSPEALEAGLRKAAAAGADVSGSGPVIADLGG